MNNCKYAYLCYEHEMDKIKTAFRLGTYNSQIDFCPQVEKYKKNILKKMR